MYNWVDNHNQLEEFERDLWYRDRNKPSIPASEVEILPCREDTNGEWVPVSDELEGIADTTSVF